MGKVKIGDFLHRIKRPIVLNSNVDYKLVTIKMHHKGVVLRGLKKGSEIKSKMYEVKKGDFILSGIDARNGAFGIVPEELDGAIVTNDFWYFSLDEKIIDKHFFLELTSTSWFDEICRLGSDGTTQRIRLQKDKFFNQEINLPSLDEQQDFISKFIHSKTINNKIEKEIDTQQKLLKKLRQSILQEAIEGKLTKEWRGQNPDVEQASVLLEKIKQEKEQLIKEKKIKKQKPLPPISEDEIPFEIPDSWEWCRLDEISLVGTGATPLTSNQAYYKDGTINWITSSATGDDFVFKAEKKITELAIEETNCNINPIGTLVIAMYGQGKTRGQITELMIESATNQACATINPYIKNIELRQFLKKYFNFIYLEIRKLAAGGSQPNLNMLKIRQTVTPLPPLQEQKEIVKKIENLFAVCDALEYEIQSSKKSSEQLMQAVLKEAFEK